jgi:hypothetical protein
MNAYSILFFFKTSVSVFGDYFESLHVMNKIPISSPLGVTLCPEAILQTRNIETKMI